MANQRAFLKWAGGKFKLIDILRDTLPENDVLFEPFVGGGSVFLNVDYPAYVLCDINPDLIGMYNTLKMSPDNFIADAKTLFVPTNNAKDKYLALREQFNQSTDVYERGLLFLYMNRHGFNGLCRYNGRGGFNVTFGDNASPYFPQAEMEFFAERAQRATFVVGGYEETLSLVAPNTTIYADPPYVPLSKTANFTGYAGNSFTVADWVKLLDVCEQRTRQLPNVHAVVSNHDLPLVRDLLIGSHVRPLEVQRNISCKGETRQKVGEILAHLPSRY